MLSARCSVRYVNVFKGLLTGLMAGFVSVWPCQAKTHTLVIEHQVPAPTHLEVEQAISRWSEKGRLQDYLNDFFLQSGYVNLEARVLSDDTHRWVTVRKLPDVRIGDIHITGGSPQDRYITLRNLNLKRGETFERQRFLENVKWVKQNHFFPLQIQFTRANGQVDIDIHIPLGPAWIPTGNLAQNSITGLSLTGGFIVDNPLGKGLVARTSIKRNNIATPFQEFSGELQDWEYVLSLSSTQQAIPGMSVGVNHYNKIDFIYPGHNDDPDQLLWIRSRGVDLYSGFQLWEDLENHRFLRGVVNVSLLEDRFFSRLEPDTYPQTQTQSGKPGDVLLLPSFTLSYSDIDNFRIPGNGNFLQGRLSTGFIDATYSQLTLTGLSFWSPYKTDQSQVTLLLRSAAGTTVGPSPPFYRGFLNTGRWLVRGATQFSITERHSLRLSEEIHYIYRPTPIQLDKTAFPLTGETGTLGYLDNWAFDVNAFLDQGGYWGDSWAWESAQLSAGIGLNAIVPNGSIVGVDFALPVYPDFVGISAMLRISAPLNFTLYSDWFNSNGFFLR